MSVECIVWSLRQQVVKEPAARLVLLVLANYAHEDGKSAYPSIATLSRGTGLCERTIKRHLATLTEAGLIQPGRRKIVEAAIDRPDRRPNIYDLNIGMDISERSDAESPRESSGVTLTTERGDFDDRAGCHKVTQSVIDPIKEIQREGDASRSPPPEPVKAKPPKPKREDQKLADWRAEQKALGRKPLEEYAGLWSYTEAAGIPTEFVALAWHEFVIAHTTGARKDKRQKDWCQTFLNAVRGNWYRLWFVGDAGYQLTTAGIQAQRAADDNVTKASK